MAWVTVQLLTYLAPYVTALSVLPLRVVFPLVAMENLTRTSSDEAIEKHIEELELGVSEALGISLSEVQAWYFLGSDGSERRDRDLDDEREHEHWLEEWVEEHQVEHWCNVP
jgi:hypothetical protein